MYAPVCLVILVLCNSGVFFLKVSNLLRLVGERRRWSGRGVLSQCRGAGSVGEVCERRLAGESLAPYEAKRKHLLLPMSK